MRLKPKMELLCDFPCKTQYELEQCEKYWINETMNCLTLLEIGISQMFPRPGVQREYPEVEMGILVAVM